ncbi:hypothetical protein [Oceanobacillus zhaokaii]|uniref:hypothetical protein n=1 Tax=Oceanobacillus zhaokaii TaxID=2052660 RepID=UPI0013B36E11|nr:hypothetical protein [Oceanobacillus zhaokaii]
MTKGVRLSGVEYNIALSSHFISSYHHHLLLLQQQTFENNLSSKRLIARSLQAG